MSKIQINAFFRFCRVKITTQRFHMESNMVFIETEPDKRYNPICHNCGSVAMKIHSYNKRMVRDLNMFKARTFIRYTYRTLRCDQCGLVVEDLGLAEPYARVTKRLAQYIWDLCQLLTIKEIAELLELDWKTIKDIHKSRLKERFSQPDIGNPKLLAVDEISLKKRHKYLTVVTDWESGRVLWVSQGRGEESLEEFFCQLTPEVKKGIKAIAMDMWDPYIKAVKDHCPGCDIVFDQFHVVSSFGRVIDKVRNIEFRKANQVGKEVIKGSKYILLKNPENLFKEEKPKLKAILKLNKALSTVYILKDYLKRLWQYRYPKCAKRFLHFWCSLAFQSKIKPVIQFAKTLTRYAYGIINHCRFPIHTSRLEGINNRIKVIKRKAYGFHDVEYFSLIIKCTFNK
jgi:transposase